MNRKRILYVILSVLLVWLIVLGLRWDGEDDQLSEDPSGEDTDPPASDCAPAVCWDGALYLRGEDLDEAYVKEYVKQDDLLGEITEIVDISGMPEENGQSNTPTIPVGSEIYPVTIYEKDLAVCKDGEWCLLRYCRENR